MLAVFFFSEMDENYARNYLRNMLKIITRGTSKLSQISLAQRLVKLRITILKYHSWNLCQSTNNAIICSYYYPQRLCNFHMQVFQIKLKYHSSEPIKLQMNFSCSSIMLKIMLTVYQSLMRKPRGKSGLREEGERSVFPHPTPSPNKPQALKVFFNAHFSLRHSLHNWRLSQARHRFMRALLTAGY